MTVVSRTRALSRLRVLAALPFGVASLPAHAVVIVGGGGSVELRTFTWEYRYDSERRLVGTIAPDPDGDGGPLHFAAVRNTYDADGRLTKVETGELATMQAVTIAPSAWTGFTIFKTADYTYDGDGRKTKETLTADGAVESVTQTSYDAVDRPVCTAVRMEPSVWTSQADACTPQLTSANGPDRITKTIYNPTGTVDRIQKAFGTGIQQDYVAYTYDGANLVTSVTDANQNRAAYTYDAFNRLTRWYFPSKVSTGVASTDDYEAYTYDNNGNRLSLKKRDGSVLNYTYDALNRNTVKIVPEGGGLIADMTRDVYYGYDNRGLMTYARFDSSAGAGIVNNYDSIGRLQNTTNSLIPGSKTLSFSYDADSNRTRITHPDANYYDTAYDGMDRSTAVWWTNNAYTSQGTVAYINRPASSTVYTFDGSSRLTHLGQHFASSANNLEQDFGYNQASQLVRESRDNDAFAWNAAISVNRAYAVNGLNQYTQSGPDNLAYDANGNLTSDTVGSTTTNWVYDRENRLVWTNLPTTTAIYYDPLGRLSMTNTTSGNHYFLYDGNNLAAEYDGVGNLTKRFVFGTGTDQPLAEAGATFDCSSARFLHANQQGSIVAQADCSGNRTAVNTYDEYGINGPTNVGRFQYTGQMWMPELGLYYYKARMYSPTLGRFMQTDPIGYSGGINLYAYVGNDPTNRYDPSGLRACEGPPGPDGKPTTIPNCRDDPATEKPNPDGKTTTQTTDTDAIVIKGSRHRPRAVFEDPFVIKTTSAGPRLSYIPSDQMHPIKVTCPGGRTSDGFRIDSSAYADSIAGGHFHEPGYQQGPSEDDGSSIASRGVPQNVGTESGVVVLEYSNYGYRERLIAGRWGESAAESRATIGRFNRGGGYGSRSGGSCTVKDR